MDFLKKLKLFLYAASFAEIFGLGYIGRVHGDKTYAMYAALALLAVNIAVYHIVKYVKTRGK
ncbi:MAG: hypothetical protein LBR69_04560 [Endomicrobium sp.]|jgi:uncharacterized membrane protein|nr:hypothetical protein [Endomicrobium sp.]